MPTLAERKTALENALYQGAKTVIFPDRSSVEYKSDKDLRAALALVDAEIAGETGVPVPRVFRLSTSKGFGLGGE